MRSAHLKRVPVHGTEGSGQGKARRVGLFMAALRRAVRRGCWKGRLDTCLAGAEEAGGSGEHSSEDGLRTRIAGEGGETEWGEGALKDTSL